MKKSTLYNLFRRNLLLKILSVFFALILWSYVMAVMNPPRDKTVQDVAVGFANEDQLLKENLVIRGDRQQILKSIDVRTTVNARDYSSLTPEGIKATVDLSNIYTPGIYTLEVHAVPIIPNVKIVDRSINPSTIDVEVDTLATRVVPVQPQFEGELPAGFWRSAPELSPQTLQIKGPMKDLEKVQQAVCYIPLDGATEPYNDSMRVVLMDAAGVVVGNTAFDLPSVIVKMNILPKKTVDIDIDAALIGVDRIAEGYEIKDIRVTPERVEIAAPRHTLDSILRLSIDSINLQNINESILTTVSIKKPEGITLLSDGLIEVLVDIVEKERIDLYENLPIEIEGLPRGFIATLSLEQGSISLNGPLSNLNAVKKSNLGLYVDASGLSEGIHTLYVKSRMTKDKLTDITEGITPVTVVLTLRKK